MYHEVLCPISSKHENLSWDSKYPWRKLVMAILAYDPITEEAETGEFGASWLDNLAE